MCIQDEGTLIHLIIIDPPTVSGNTTKQVQAGIRRRLGLTCSIQNHPIALEEVEFQWYRNGTKFNIPGGRIRKLGRPEDSTRLTTSTVDVSILSLNTLQV